MKTTQEIKAELMKKMEAANKRELLAFQVHTEIASYMAKHEGQKISKRISSYIKELHPTWTVHYEDGNASGIGQYYIRYWGGDSGLTFDNRGSHFLAYSKANGSKENLYSVEEFSGFSDYATSGKPQGRDCCNGWAAAERIVARNAMILDGTLDRLAEAGRVWMEADSAIEQTFENAREAHYALEAIIGRK